ASRARPRRDPRRARGGSVRSVDTPVGSVVRRRELLHEALLHLAARPHHDADRVDLRTLVVLRGDRAHHLSQVVRLVRAVAGSSAVTYVDGDLSLGRGHVGHLERLAEPLQDAATDTALLTGAPGDRSLLR